MKNNNLHEVRLIAATLVVFGHAFVLSGKAAPVLFGLPIHALAVKVFFVVSGYLITMSLMLDRSFYRYSLKRVLRIYPAYAVCILLSVIAGAYVSTLSFSEYISHDATQKYLRNLFFLTTYRLPGVFEENVNKAVNGSLWSIPIEVFAYMSIAVVVGLLKFNKKLLPIVLACLGVFVMMYVEKTLGETQHTVIWGSSTIFAARVLQYFILGSLVYLMSLEKYLNVNAALLLCLLLVFISKELFYEVTKVFIISYATLSFSLSDRPIKFYKHFQKNDYSYGIYLYAFPVQQFVVMAFSGVSVYGQFSVSMIVICMMAYFSWHIVEKPALDLKPRRKSEGLAYGS